MNNTLFQSNVHSQKEKRNKYIQPLAIKFILEYINTNF